jgi:hypothetical protein
MEGWKKAGKPSGHCNPFQLITKGTCATPYHHISSPNLGHEGQRIEKKGAGRLAGPVQKRSSIFLSLGRAARAVHMAVTCSGS